MLTLGLVLQLSFKAIENQSRYEGPIVSIADYNLTKRLSFYVNVTRNDSHQCLKLYKNTGSVEHDSVLSDTGALINTENPESDLCVEEANNLALVKVQAFDYAKSGYVHLLLSF